MTLNEEQRAQSTTSMERALDAVAATVALAGQTGAVVSAVGLALAKLGLNFKDCWSNAAAAHEQGQFEQVVFGAVEALHQGNPEVAAANFAAHCANPRFRARIFTTVNLMRESAPVEEALGPLGVIVAIYDGKRPDVRFRRIVSALCDMNSNEIIGTKAIIEFLANPAWKLTTVFGFRLAHDAKFDVLRGAPPSVGEHEAIYFADSLPVVRSEMSLAGHVLLPHGILSHEPPKEREDSVAGDGLYIFNADDFHVLSEAFGHVAPPLPGLPREADAAAPEPIEQREPQFRKPMVMPEQLPKGE